MLRLSFVHHTGKYETVRRQLKRQELVAYEQEARNDVRTESLLSIIEGKRTQLEALQRILGQQIITCIQTINLRLNCIDT